MRICCESSVGCSMRRSGCWPAMTLLQPAHEPQGAPAACSHNTSRATHLASQSPPAPGASCSSKACGSLPAACAAAKAAISVLTQDRSEEHTSELQSQFHV